MLRYTGVRHRCKQVWKSVNTLELEIAGDRLSTHTQETGDTEGRRHAGYSAADLCNNEVQVAVISILVIECVVIGGRWSLTCL
ncbi:hypothetical protein DPX16_21920 [Anabarilius grahami]|uniref:Uncharacterized protein n=1 Tax=Anabarilius grahami TaxID=495550 RepID=A0A3N0XMI1_ANAGA|nr:hypothetical protein DPX16_21920 [Anabarilius grahami]